MATKQHSPSLKDAFKNARVLVVGDIMLDRFIYGSVVRISPEAPVPVVHTKGEETYLGAAGNVARNIAALGGRTLLAGVVGKDAESLHVIEKMEAYNIPCEGIIIDTERPTITKTRIVAGTQQVVRIDNEDLSPFPAETERALLAFVFAHMETYNVIVLSDYGKGVITKKTARAIIKRANEKGVLVLVDPSVYHFPLYKNVTGMTPNLKEAQEGSGIALADDGLNAVVDLGKKIIKKLALASLMITLGPDGMMLFTGEDEGKVTHIPTNAKSVYDVSGAGDTVIATMAMGLSVGLTFEEAARIANYAAGVVVEKRGTATVTPEELSKAGARLHA